MVGGASLIMGKIVVCGQLLVVMWEGILEGLGSCVCGGCISWR